ncbi:hypothetical protein L7F22_051625 [Adiantum nelumboides]|nr:hypothetical protein [Adiantum nelumboides]
MHHHHHDPELSTTQSASSSSCDGDALHNITSEEGQGESSCDDHSARNSSILSRRHDVVLCPSDTGTARFVSRRGANTAANDRSSYFSKDVEQEQEYFQQILGSSSFGWTDEKHSSYLDSMEADFLGSVMFGGNAHADQEASSDLCDSASSQQVKSSKEFKVCQNGRWRPKSLNASPYVGPIAQVAVVVKNPWIKRFRSSSKPRVSPTLFLEDPLVQVAMNSRRR